ncbi:hypothetical protein GOP47_0022771 [Adiantum capillus-veneris]|uniref:Uncharacterized protein n=1 Tax=Adiantum capillus-veneris TaxID=13818 RepID=A0A9D4U745_ADICA|nr:hypothetical protein GOP47_0022771 [Adiantum capillus-veneris]
MFEPQFFVVDRTAPYSRWELVLAGCRWDSGKSPTTLVHRYLPPTSFCRDWRPTRARSSLAFSFLNVQKSECNSQLTSAARRPSYSPLPPGSQVSR